MMNSTEEETVVASLRERDADLAQKIIDEMFVFDNLLDVEDRAIQLILKEIDNDTLMVALKGAQEELRAKFLRNMSSRAAEMLREDLEAQGPIRMSKVEAEQKKILQIARRLAESGQIVLGNSGDDAYVGHRLDDPALAQRALAALADAVVRRAAARRGRARAGTRSRPGPEVVLAQLRPGRGRGPRGRLRAASRRP